MGSDLTLTHDPPSDCLLSGSSLVERLEDDGTNNITLTHLTTHQCITTWSCTGIVFEAQTVIYARNSENIANIMEACTIIPSSIQAQTQ